MSPIVVAPEAPISRCSGCGGWVWIVDIYGCNTCRTFWATHGVTDSQQKEIA